VWLNGALLFVVMIYIYPLKFLFALLAGPDGMARGVRDQRMIRYDQLPALMVIYGLGFAAIFLVLAAMYYRGWRKRIAAAGRGDDEAHMLAYQIGHCLVYVAVAALSMAIATFGGPGAVGIAGMFYGVLGPAHGIYHGVVMRRARRARAAAATTAGPETESR
jgi:hypothetical protein